MTKFYLFLISFLSITPLFGQEILRGKVSSEGENLVGANVYWLNAKIGTVSNVQGEFAIRKIPNDSLCASFVGFIQQCFTPKELSINFILEPASVLTDEVEITARKKDFSRDVNMGIQKMDLKQIEELPAFMGEVDILKSIQLLPGVQSSGEGNSGYYVRGGGPDQNLILLDKAPVYNASHLLGLFSIFNHNAIENPTLIKGGMPAKYGNRLASVLHIPSKTGDFEKHHFGGGIGLIASRFYAEGPIAKGKVSYLVTGRRTYIDAVAAPLIPKDAQAKGSSYFFYDFNAKISAKLSDSETLDASFYIGDDVFKYVNKKSQINLRIPWGNLVAQTTYTKKFSEKLTGDLYFYYDQYDFALQSQFDQFSIGVRSAIQEFSLGSDWNYQLTEQHKLGFGIQSQRNIYLPTFAEASSGSTDFNTGEKNELLSNQFAAYIQDSWNISRLLSLQYGLRLSLFQHIGPFTRFLEPDAGATSAKLRYKKGAIVSQDWGLEPRIASRFITGVNNSIKASYTNNIQYLHLASISPVSLPTDIWIPTSSKIKPQRGNQYAFGFFQELPKWSSEFSVELYYKDMKNLVEYKENTTPEDNLNDNVDNQLIQGRGYSYGAEFFVKRKKGNFNGWIGYTYSVTERVFKEFNNGNPYPAKYDRTHDLALVGTYKLNNRWTFGANFVYGTGNAISLPTTRYFSFFDGRVLGVYNDRNSFRMPSYHRFDLSATLYPKEKENRKFKSWWVFSIYNVYSRQNPYFLYFDVEGNLGSNTLKLSAKQVSLFPILPSVTWNFEF